MSTLSEMTSSRSKRTSSEYFFEPQMKKILSDESEEHKNSIYKKTIEKLKQGATRSFADASKITGIQSTILDRFSGGPDLTAFKQISLNFKCELERDSKVINPKEYCPVLPEYCSFCERLRCFVALRECTICAEYFCRECYFLTFVNSEETPVCKSCFQ